jgi:adenosylmethionine-8-amino-7-oxononanoate aminotransferase
VLDGSSGLFCSPAGHCRPEIAAAVAEQLSLIHGGCLDCESCADE